MNETAEQVGGAPEQVNTALPPPTQEQRIQNGLKNLVAIHEKDTIVEMVCIAIVKGAPVPIVMAAGSSIERSALLARYAAEGLTAAAISELIPEGDHV